MKFVEVYEMSRNLTELVFVIDKSGSMHGLESDTIGGFNSMISEQRETRSELDEVLVSTVLFSDESDVVSDRIPINRIEPMTDSQYRVGGCTALLDTLGGAIRHIGNVHKYARKEDVPDRTLFVVITDGLENASRRYSHEEVRKLIDRQRDRYGWEFMFLGANMDAVTEATGLGFSSKNSVTYCCDSVGTSLNYNALGGAISSFRSRGEIDENWKASIEEDMRKRGGKRSR